MRHPLYVWRNNECVDVGSYSNLTEDGEKKLFDLYMVDTDPLCGPTYRYGTIDSDHQWMHIPLDQFPVEFRTNLLLLGIT